MPFDEKSPPRIFCTACGMPHHEDCYMENGGCTVFGCSRAPAEEPKLQVSYSDLNAAPAVAQPAMQNVQQTPAAAVTPATNYGSGPLGLSQPASAAAPAAQGTAPQPFAGAATAAQPVSLPGYAYAQPASVRARVPKSRTTYILLGVFLGFLGVHNFYAGYTGRAVGQLCLSALTLFYLTLFYLAVASWIWAIVEICTIDKDSSGLQFN
jgi:TM2 domain-containing membrane protein YozV